MREFSRNQSSKTNLKSQNKAHPRALEKDLEILQCYNVITRWVQWDKWVQWFNVITKWMQHQINPLTRQRPYFGRWMISDASLHHMR